MLCYKVGTKVVPLAFLETAPDWFLDAHVVVDRLDIDGECYRVTDINKTCHSWLSDDEIDHVETDKLNMEDK